MRNKHTISRRDFLKLAALGAGALALRPFAKLVLPEFPQAAQKSMLRKSDLE